jgi:DNA-binding transcriptional ArsR family regulator
VPKAGGFSFCYPRQIVLARSEIPVLRQARNEDFARTARTVVLALSLSKGEGAPTTLPRNVPALATCEASAFTLTLNYMVQYGAARLDVSFSALADATRRGVLEELERGEASITDLASRFHMTLTGMKKHISVLEQAGLVTTQKVGRVRTCRLGADGLAAEAAWIERYRRRWTLRFDELDKVVEDLKREEEANGRK